MSTETVSIGIEYFLPTDARHWIPNGFDVVDLEIDSVALAEDYYLATQEAAEVWCERTHGVGSFCQVINEP